MRDGIQSRRARIERAKARALRHGTKLGSVKFKRASFDVVGVDGAIKEFGQRTEDAFHLQLILVGSGQFLPDLMTHCLDGTPVPYEAWDEDRIEKWLADHSERVVFFDKEKSQRSADGLSEYRLRINPPPSLTEHEMAQADEAHGFDAPVEPVNADAPVAFDGDRNDERVDEVHTRLSPEVRAELDAFEEDRRIIR